MTVSETPDNDAETLIRVTCQQDVYDALNLLHTRCIDNLGTREEDREMTILLGSFMEQLLDRFPEIQP
jgi:hypothetical protein